MKVTKIEIIKLAVPAGVDSRHVICRVHTDEGITGLGEACVAIVSGAYAAAEMIKDLSKLVIGMNPLHHEVLWEKMFKASFWGKGNGAIVMAAISALDTAFWDIKGKYYNAPVYELLGGKHRDKLRSYASQLQFGWGSEVIAPRGSEEDYRAACYAALEQGYDAVKTDVLQFDENGVRIPFSSQTSHLSKKIMRMAEKRMQIMRDVLGEDVDIILENHANTDANTAIQLGRMAQAYDVMFYEEPTLPLNPSVCRKVYENVSIPLATGERTFTRWGFEQLFKTNSISVIQPDIGNCGGVTECKKICDMAHIHDISVQTHVCSSHLNLAVSLHLEAAIPNFIIHEHHINSTLPSVAEQFVYDYQPVNGYITVPDLPGFGQELSEKAEREALIEVVS